MDHVHAEQESEKYFPVDECCEGVHRITISRPPSLRRYTGRIPTWWSPPKIRFRATEMMKWYANYDSGYARATYSGFDESTSTLWVYKYVCQHDRLWSPGDLPEGTPFKVEKKDFSFAIVDVDGGSTTTVLASEASGAAPWFLRDLQDFAFDTFPDRTWINYGPDASYRTIRITCDGDEMQLSSWHPIYEQKPSVVAGSHGLTTLNGQTREEFLGSDDQEYVAKRDAFDEIERRLTKRFGAN